eukprot:CAMPEP_0174983586 /NCGR_PEP_ID=MMETSP0004_2-20121128/17223_1 /TAXON_ID=420556 /ORGANISM="Ochromonas sp., Strain CCMP1393" /LENGTH=301 /DNA_ID=CAMNT_0016235849 /DNA_START=232 /DNA_END=1137 /DNA_ORIENTATION=-
MESSNYYFEMQDQDPSWWLQPAVKSDMASSTANFKESAQIVLFIINPQNDFYPGGVCAVPDAGAGSARIAKLIREHGSKFSRIIVAMATHQYCHISHASSWMDARQQPPAVGTRITYKSLLEGDWQPRSILQQEWCEQYTMKLETKCKKFLTIEPEYCIVGTLGHGVHGVVHSALQEWCAQSASHRTIQYLHHGHNQRAAMYSAVRAAVEDPMDPSTAVNTTLMDTFRTADQVFITGPRLSHCIATTTRDLIDMWGANISKLVILTDGGAVSPGYEANTEEFLDFARIKGCRVCRCAEAFE